MTTEQFNSIVTNHVKQLHQSAYFFTRNQNDADDLVQDTLEKVLKFRDYFQEGTNFGAWTYVIMKNTFINNKRKAKRQISYDYSIEPDSRNPAIEPVEFEMDADKIFDHIENKTDDPAKALTLFAFGFKYEEIAAQLNKPVGTIKSNIFSARNKLKHTLKYWKDGF